MEQQQGKSPAQSYLERVKTTVVAEHGTPRRTGPALVAALALAMGCAAPAMASESEQVSRFSAAVDAVKTSLGFPGGRLPGPPEIPKASDVTVRGVVRAAVNISSAPTTLAHNYVVEPAIAGVAGAATKDSGVAMEVAKWGTTALAASSVAPVVAAFLVYDRGMSTYEYIQEREVKEDLAAQASVDRSALRMESIRQQAVMDMRMEERATRTLLPADQFAAEQERMFKSAVAELEEWGALSDATHARMSTELACASAGQATEPWFDRFKQYESEYADRLEAESVAAAKAEQESAPPEQEAAPAPAASNAMSFRQGMDRLNVALAAQEMENTAGPAVKYQSMR